MYRHPTTLADYNIIIWDRLLRKLRTIALCDTIRRRTWRLERYTPARLCELNLQLFRKTKNLDLLLRCSHHYAKPTQTT